MTSLLSLRRRLDPARHGVVVGVCAAVLGLAVLAHHSPMPMGHAAAHTAEMAMCLAIAGAALRTVARDAPHRLTRVIVDRHRPDLAVHAFRAAATAPARAGPRLHLRHAVLRR